MRPKNIIDALGGIDADMIADAERKIKKRSPWLKWAAIAACLCLGAAVSLSIIVPIMLDTHEDSITFDANVFPDKLNGSALEFVVGSSSSVSGGSSAAPPKFEFFTGGYIVKVKAVKSFPDEYYKLDVSSSDKPVAYRLIQMETIEVIRGKEIPKYFLYMIRSSLFVDMSVYDSLLISMSQIGAENYVMRNGSQSQIEAFELPVFGDYQDHPELGNIIAFTNSKFDESLWQNKSWKYGYQFAKNYLDNSQWGDLVVKRGCTEKYTINEINAKIKERMEWLGDKYTEPTVLTLDFASEGAKRALDYVKPFENGVFSQSLSMNTGNRQIFFRRFINGCQTEETITIDFVTEEVTYSEVRYSKEDMEYIENIAMHISNRAKEYTDNIPKPPHIKTEGKELRCLNLYGWYVKVDDKVYGIVKTVWKYTKKTDGWYAVYYDEAFTIYEAASATAKNISRESLVKLVGTRNIYQGEYGKEQIMPMY